MAKLLVVGALLATLTTGIVMADHSASYHAYKLVTVGNTTFRNWDFKSTSESQSNVDWPVTMVFTNGATVDLVHDIFSGDPTIGSSKYFRHSTDGTWRWDSDTGKKHGSCFNTYYHIRAYGQYYNTTWGNHVLATTHIDKWECFPWDWYGESEEAEEWFNDLAEDLEIDVEIDEDSFYMQNWESFRQVGEHRVRNSGYATVYDMNLDD